ncbi:glycosyltransferase [Synechococcus sp. CS-197]|uniref:glycosyltransferase family protein n=1 Tax=Synechococcus sp. CS-197 TaxID=2847985 RepID=UPI00223ABAE4|nr:glycosyltransferase [Synechococcus sp. CS-197]
MRACPLQGVRQWPGPRLLACGDLHHGPAPLDTLAAYQGSEPHDAVVLTFNPALLEQVQARLNVPVRCLAPSFFRYPAAQRTASPERVLLHVGSLGPHHPKRRELVEALQARCRIPFRHATTTSAEGAAELYARHALVLNVPLNHDLNHRVFEVMAAGTAQVVVADPSLVGPLQHLAERPDVFWASSIEQLEALVQELFASPGHLRNIQVEPPPYWELTRLLKTALAPDSIKAIQL